MYIFKCIGDTTNKRGISMDIMIIGSSKHGWEIPELAMEVSKKTSRCSVTTVGAPLHTTNRTSHLPCGSLT